MSRSPMSPSGSSAPSPSWIMDRWAVILAAAWLAGAGVANDAHAQALPESPPSKEQIHALIAEITGLNLDMAHAEMESVVIPKPPFPFLDSELPGNRVQRIVQKHVSIALPSAPPGTLGTISGECEILLDGAAKHLVRILIKPDHLPRKVIALASKESAEVQLRARGQTYEWFPEAAPKITFTQAVDIVREKGVGSPTNATEIEGYYVNYVKYLLGNKPRPV